MWRWVAAIGSFGIFFGLTWLLLTQAIIGPGYALWRVQGEYGFVVKDQALLSRIATRIREAGGIVYTAAWVTSGGVDAQDGGKSIMPENTAKENPNLQVHGLTSRDTVQRADGSMAQKFHSQCPLHAPW